MCFLLPVGTLSLFDNCLICLSDFTTLLVFFVFLLGYRGIVHPPSADESTEPGSSPYQTLLVWQSSCVTPRVALTFGLLMGFAAMTIFISRRCGVHVYLGLAALTHFWFRSPSFRPTRQKFLCVCWVDLNIVRPFCSVAMDKLGFELVNK